MTLTSAFCGPASTAASSAPDSPQGGVCAMHQPNLFPRLSKLFAADRWIVLDDVQFARRDYQHWARLAGRDEPARQQWLTLPTRLPQGRPTLISQARLVDFRRSRRTVQMLVRQYFGRSPHWQAVSDVLDQALETLDNSDRVAEHRQNVDDCPAHRPRLARGGVSQQWDPDPPRPFRAPGGSRGSHRQHPLSVRHRGRALSRHRYLRRPRHSCTAVPHPDERPPLAAGSPRQQPLGPERDRPR